MVNGKAQQLRYSIAKTLNSVGQPIQLSVETPDGTAVYRDRHGSLITADGDKKTDPVSTNIEVMGYLYDSQFANNFEYLEAENIEAVLILDLLNLWWLKNTDLVDTPTYSPKKVNDYLVTADSFSLALPKLKSQLRINTKNNVSAFIIASISPSYIANEFASITLGLRGLVEQK